MPKHQSTKSFYLTADQGIAVLQVLKKLMNSHFQQTRSSFLVARLMTALDLNPDLIAADRTRVSLVRQFGVELADKGGFIVPEEKQAEFQKEYASISKTKIALRPSLCVPMACFDGLVELTLGDMVVLQSILSDTEEINDETR